MVDVKELRIGNAVLDDCGLPVTIDSIEKAWNERNEFYYMFYDNRMSENLNPDPIALTEEWLIKFGFKKESKVSGSKGSVGFNVYRFGLFVFNTSHDKLWFNSNILHIQPKYVHQLQNLHFALTGKELEYVQ